MTRICFYAGQDDILHSCRTSVQTQCANAETRSRNVHPGTRNRICRQHFQHPQTEQKQNIARTLVFIA